MKISDRAEEILETLWTETEEGNRESMGIGIARGESEVDELLNSGHIRLIGDNVRLTEKGRDAGRKIVRRHRLAERLFADILDIKKKLGILGSILLRIAR